MSEARFGSSDIDITFQKDSTALSQPHCLYSAPTIPPTTPNEVRPASLPLPNFQSKKELQPIL